MEGLLNISIITVMFSVTFSYPFTFSELQHAVIQNEAIESCKLELSESLSQQ